MGQIYEVFDKERRIILGDKARMESSSGMKKYSPADDSELKEVISSWLAESYADVFVHLEDVDSGWKIFCDFFEMIEAAGGLVENDEGAFLLIYRNGFWDLPKGKMEPGESVVESAVREVQEECGLENLDVVKPLPTSYHIYAIGKRLILKPTHWFWMKSNDQDLVPQENEGIMEVKWVEPEEAGALLKTGFRSLDEWFRRVVGKK